jgi:hypothetical protein
MSGGPLQLTMKPQMFGPKPKSLIIGTHAVLAFRSRVFQLWPPSVETT